MAKVWPGPMDPRDYRMQEQEEKFEGPAFKQMMKNEPEHDGKPVQGPRPARQHNPHKKPVRQWYERS